MTSINRLISSVPSLSWVFTHCRTHFLYKDVILKRQKEKSAVQYVTHCLLSRDSLLGKLGSTDADKALLHIHTHTVPSPCR